MYCILNNKTWKFTGLTFTRQDYNNEQLSNYFTFEVNCKVAKGKKYVLFSLFNFFIVLTKHWSGNVAKKIKQTEKFFILWRFTSSMFSVGPFEGKFCDIDFELEAEESLSDDTSIKVINFNWSWTWADKQQLSANCHKSPDNCVLLASYWPKFVWIFMG